MLIESPQTLSSLLGVFGYSLEILWNLLVVLGCEDLKENFRFRDGSYSGLSAIYLNKNTFFRSYFYEIFFLVFCLSFYFIFSTFWRWLLFRYFYLCDYSMLWLQDLALFLVFSQTFGLINVLNPFMLFFISFYVAVRLRVLLCVLSSK